MYVCCVMHLVLLFFFFQAEDGIRDDLVTGVQTCALPISPRQIFNLKIEIIVRATSETPACSQPRTVSPEPRRARQAAARSPADACAPRHSNGPSRLARLLGHSPARFAEAAPDYR